MKSGAILRMEMPHREPMVVHGCLFGDESGRKVCAIVGSTRGNEAQQAFICAQLVSRLRELEASGSLVEGACVLVIPCVNPYSMNILSRFWPADGSDINRMFPGDEHGGTTERVAFGVMRAVRSFEYGIQLCSFNQPGDFLPHVRVMRQGPISDESLELAEDFGLPFVLRREPTPFDTSTLNYAWQAAGTHAFSLYSRVTDRLDERSALEVEEAVLRFLDARHALALPAEGGVARGVRSTRVDDGELVDVRTMFRAGYLLVKVRAGEKVGRGQLLAEVCDAFDARVLEQLVSPVDGRVFFVRNDPLVQQDMVVARIVRAS